MNNTFVFIGDSLTYGYGVNKKDNWVSKLKNTFNYNIINKGINGDTTANMLDRFSEDVVEKSPSLIFIMGGTNDLLSNRSISSIISNIELMIKDCINIGSTVILGLPPAIIKNDAMELFSPMSTYNYCEEKLPILRQKLIELSSKYNSYYLDFYNLTVSNLNNDIFNDGIHLNPRGQSLLYKEALKLLQNMK